MDERGTRIVDAEVIEHSDFNGGYRLLVLDAPAVASKVQPGQFVHLRIPRLDDAVLRRPFSVYRADDRSLSILYKRVGRGTRSLGHVSPGTTVSIIGPLGNGFPSCDTDKTPILVAGGYGVAPLYLLASRLTQKGTICIGGASARDILCASEFEALGWDVRLTTDDGTLGSRGLVTSALDAWIEEAGDDVRAELYACGPDGMLKAVGARAIAKAWNGWISLDKHMGCGIGACLACVQRIRQPDGSVVWMRVCREGPIFEAATIVWND